MKESRGDAEEMELDEEEDGSEINWLDDDNGGGDADYAENNDEYGFDLSSTRSVPLLHKQKQQRRPSAGSGNQKGIKLNSNYHEDAEIGAFNGCAVVVGDETGRHHQQLGKNNVCDWTKVRNNNCKRAGRMGIANEEISDGNQNAFAIDGDEVSEAVSAGARAEGGMGLSGVAEESRYSGSNSNNNKGNNNDRILAGESASKRGAAADIVDELETVVLRLASTEDAETRGNSTLATTCVT